MNNIGAVFFVVMSWLVSHPAALAQPASCKNMANMAKDIANIRDMGVPKNMLEERMRRDLKGREDELLFALLAINIVYKTKATGSELQREVLKKC